MLAVAQGGVTVCRTLPTHRREPKAAELLNVTVAELNRRVEEPPE